MGVSDFFRNAEFAPLTRIQMCNAIERKGGDIPRVPLGWAKFFNAGTAEKYGQELVDLNAAIVDDFVSLRYTRPGNLKAPEGAPEAYRWAIEEGREDLSAKGFTSRLVSY